VCVGELAVGTTVLKGLPAVRVRAPKPRLADDEEDHRQLASRLTVMAGVIVKCAMSFNRHAPGVRPAMRSRRYSHRRACKGERGAPTRSPTPVTGATPCAVLNFTFPVRAQIGD